MRSRFVRRTVRRRTVRRHPVRRRSVGITVALAMSCALVACTRSATPQPIQTAITAQPTGLNPATVPTLDPSSIAVTATPSTSSPAPSSSAASSSPASSAPISSSASPPPSTGSSVAGGCVPSSLKITVRRGSGVAGHQYATVVFTNSGTASCTLGGYPGIQLQSNNAPLGKSIRGGPATGRTITLQPGAAATSALVNDSTCGAAQSDAVQVFAPNTFIPTVLPLGFRGCTVTVSAVIAG